jgi:hypothetical protein
MPVKVCQQCGKEFEAKTSRRRFCQGACVCAHERKYQQQARASFSPERKRAYLLVQSAIYHGTLVRRPCEVCGGRRDIEAHHEDYSKPLDVRWLCRSHHKRLHDDLRRAP